MEIQDLKPHTDNVNTVHAIKRNVLPTMDSDEIEMCTMQEFAELLSNGE